VSTPLAIDIETVGSDWNDLDEKTQKYLQNRGREDLTAEEAEDKLPFSPGTAKVVAIGMWKPDKGSGGVLLEDEQTSSEWTDFTDDSVVHRGNEKHILEAFWDYVGKSNIGRMITYNGRSFDGPFLMLRSAMHGIRPSRTFLGYRYDFSDHCDLGEVVSAFRARTMETLDFWCKMTGIGSPKGDMDGSEVGKAYEDGEIDKIGKYCLRDAKCTGKLFKRLLPMIDVMNS